MVFTKLTEAYLPAFIYLIDRIREEEYDLDFQEIASWESKGKEMVVPRSIDRAFDLRKKLTEGWTTKKPGRPVKKTLDVLTAFLEGNSKISFLEFTVIYKDAIATHYEEHRPEQQWIDVLFGKKRNAAAERILAMEEKRDELFNMRENFSMEDLKASLEPRARRQLERLFEEWKSEELQPFLESLVETRLRKLEDKLTASKKLYRRLGGFSILFLPKDDTLLFEEDLFDAIHDFQMGAPDMEVLDESLLEEVISKFIN